MIKSLIVDSIYVKNIIGEYLKKCILDETIDFDRAQEISTFLEDNLPNNLSEEETVKLIPTLDDNFSELSNIVIQLIGQIN